ncbi:hypothetical protein BOTNAR_0023g00120 [Botryotinia narcissicola]|uniref:Uncharacterized protein n=1 Tax=Botryotinia narcissicola TaxID=278944 RepID=A0A4Z1J5P3_9HELO|nr:hypothetical protein BOTNAR_0023g00120 [Botryotinia narcissicola]
MKLGSSDVGQAPVTATNLKENDEKGEMHRRYGFAKKESAVAGHTFMEAVARAILEAWSFNYTLKLLLEFSVD